MDQYLPLVVMLVLAVGFVVLSITTARVLGTTRPTAAKSAPYESGIVPSREPPERFPIRFYLVAMIFIVLDVELIFLFPWAVIHRELGGPGLAEMLLFTFPVFVAFVYLISKGALDWGPPKRGRRLTAAIDESRTAETTIRRVGLDGRELAEETAQKVGVS